MKFRYLSDLHLEAYSGTAMGTLVDMFCPEHEDDSNSFLIIAGDLSSFPIQCAAFIEAVAIRFNGVIFVPGNHEYYRNNYDEYPGMLKACLESFTVPSNVFCSFNDVKSMRIANDVTVVYGTLWGDGAPIELHAALSDGINDFRLIKCGTDDNIKRFSVFDMMSINSAHSQKIIEKLAQSPDDKIVLITHHIPAGRLSHPRFGNMLRGGFIGGEQILNTVEPTIWVFGHTHDTIDAFIDGVSTRFLANPAGYRREMGGSEFNTFAPRFFEI